ncbi:MAG: glycosyltransferase family 2 protein [Anderseniella sp.]
MRISVVIPAYNAADTIKETLESVFSQTRLADEIVVVDDGSTDDTADAVRADFPGIKLVQTRNRGAAAALNQGISDCEGDLITFLDADDLWAPGKLEVQEAAFANNHAAHLVMGHYEAFICPSLDPARAARLQFANGLQPGYLIGCMMIRKDFLEGCRQWFEQDLRTGYHVDWLRRLRSHGVSELMLPDLVMRRRIRANTLGRRSGLASDTLTRDFLEIARRALAEKRLQKK